MVIRVIAHVRERGTGDANEPARRSAQLEAEASTYEEARSQILDRLAHGDIVASWRVDRP